MMTETVILLVNVFGFIPKLESNTLAKTYAHLIMSVEDLVGTQSIS